MAYRLAITCGSFWGKSLLRSASCVCLCFFIPVESPVTVFFLCVSSPVPMLRAVPCFSYERSSRICVTLLLVSLLGLFFFVKFTIRSACTVPDTRSCLKLKILLYAAESGLGAVSIALVSWCSVVCL